jgi:hypothetical protein
MRSDMRRLAVVCIAAIFPILCASAADQPVGFDGTWILDTKESEPFLHPVMGLAGPSQIVDTTGGDLLGGASRAATPSSRDMTAGAPGGGGTGMAGGRGAQIPVDSPPLVIRLNENVMEIARITKVNGKELPVVDRFQVDGSENVSTVQVPNAPDPVKVITKATLKKSKFVIIMTSFNPNGKSEMKKEYALSKDGKTLVLNTTNSSPRGHLVQKQVYRKQDGN